MIFTTDNGYFHAEHGLADKWYPHEESIRVPLIIRDPRMPPEQRGKTNAEFTLNARTGNTCFGRNTIMINSSTSGRTPLRKTIWPGIPHIGKN